MIGIMIDGLVGDDETGGGGEWFAATGVAGEARVSPTGDLQTYLVTGVETVSSRPEIDSKV